MKMDDVFETEIIYDIVTAHIQICKRYFAFLYVSLYNIFVLAPGETLQTKMLKPAPFMLLMFVLILISIVIQSNKSLRTYLSNLHSLLTPGAGLRFGSLADSAALAGIASCVSDAQVVQEVKDGLVGIYAMQGRRGNMEDRFSVMQDVPVGLNKRMSFFGVYDGHGGQYVAEYLRLHLFKNTVEKIKQLRSSIHSSSNGVIRSGSNRRQSEVARSPTDQSSAATDGDKKTGKDAANKDAAMNDSTKGSEGETKGSSNGSDTSNDKTCSKNNARSTSSETNSSCGAGGDEPLKKDDAYNTLNIRKKSLANIKEAGKEKEEEATDDNQQYVDMNKNINYTKLLTDQILQIDSQVVEQCRSNTDLSGSTAVVALLDGELLVVGNVGDSRAVMADDRGRAVPLSFDHKPNQLKERRRIKEAGGFISFTGVWRVAGILATSRALGDFPLKHPRPLVTAEPDILTFSLSDHKAEFVILATDGLWDVLTNEEAVSFVKSRLHESDFGAKSVAQLAYARGSQDNITVAVINFSKMRRQELR